MSDKKVTTSILLVILVFIGGYFIAQNSVTNIRTNVPHLLNEIKDSAAINNWDSASKSLTKLENIWNKGKYLIALNYAEPDYLLFIENLARLKNALEDQDQSEVKKNLVVLNMLWANFTKLVPLP